MSLFARSLLRWLPIAVAVTCLGLLGYAGVQQVYRTGADDPQVQIAHDAAYALSRGASPEAVVASMTPANTPTPVVLDNSDQSATLAPFVIVYRPDGTPVASSATLRGTTPRIPTGVLDAARSNGENRVTWQPTGSVRIAATVVADAKGDQARYIAVAGRSLHEVEKRVEALTQVAFIGWVFTLVATFVTVLLAERFLERA